MSEIKNPPETAVTEFENLILALPEGGSTHQGQGDNALNYAVSQCERAIKRALATAKVAEGIKGALEKTEVQAPAVTPASTPHFDRKNGAER